MSTEAPAAGGWARLLATLVAGGAFIVLVGLGTWQVQRLDAKQKLIARIDAGLAAAASALPTDAAALEAFAYRRVQLSGRFHHDKELYLTPRTLEGRLGVHVLTPFTFDAGAVVLVDRGWVPVERIAASNRPEGQVLGALRLEGITRPLARPNAFTPDNEAANNRWYWVDLPAMEKAVGMPLLPILVEAGSDPNPGGLPIGRVGTIDIRNDHLSYAVTWYALAVGLVAVVVVYRRRKPGAAR